MSDLSGVKIGLRHRCVISIWLCNNFLYGVMQDMMWVLSCEIRWDLGGV